MSKHGPCDDDDVSPFDLALKLACSNERRSQDDHVRWVDTAARFARAETQSNVVSALEAVFVAAESEAVDRPNMLHALEVVDAISTRGTGPLLGKVKPCLEDWLRRFLLDFPGEVELARCRRMLQAWLTRRLLSEGAVTPLLRRFDDIARRAAVEVGERDRREPKRKLDNTDGAIEESAAKQSSKASRADGPHKEHEIDKAWQALQRMQGEFKSMLLDDRAKLCAELASQAEELGGTWARAVKQSKELADLRAKVLVQETELTELRDKRRVNELTELLHTEELADLRATANNRSVQIRELELKHDYLLKEVDRRLGNVETLRLCSDNELGKLIGDTTNALAVMQRQSMLRTQETSCCVVCLDRKKTVLLRPCNHMCLCEGCGDSVQECPLCRQAITDRIRVHC